MPSGLPSGNSGGSSTSKYPIAYSFAGLVVLALIALFAIRHLFGSIRADVGVR